MGKPSLLRQLEATRKACQISDEQLQSVSPMRERRVRRKGKIQKEIERLQQIQKDTGVDQKQFSIATRSIFSLSDGVAFPHTSGTALSLETTAMTRQAQPVQAVSTSSPSAASFQKLPQQQQSTVDVLSGSSGEPGRVEFAARRGHEEAVHAPCQIIPMPIGLMGSLMSLEATRKA